MSIKERVDQVRSQLSSEELDKVGTFLEEIRSEASSLTDSLSAANSESKNRKIKIKELQDRIENIEIERDDYKTKIEGFDTSDLEKERDTFKEKYHSLLDRQKDTFVKFYDNHKEHPNWEKAKSKFKLPLTEDGKLDMENMNAEDLEHNIAVRNDLESLEYFQVTSKGGPEGGKAAPAPNLEISAIYEKRQKGDPSWRQDYDEYVKKKKLV